MESQQNPSGPPQEPSGDYNPANDYSVELDAYKGPLDLLVYLIKRTEVDIYDIPIAEITAQYLSYIEIMRQINITVAGEFVLMAATLIEIKSKMLLPRETLDDLEDDDGDPRMELVRQLLEYKRFKDAARMLEDAEEEQSKRFPRPPLDKEALRLEIPQEDENPFDGVSLWDLLTAFSKVLEETKLAEPRTIYQTDKPLKFFMVMVLESLKDQQRASFRDLFLDLKDKSVVIGVFLAILELMRLRRIKGEQAGPFGDIYLSLVDGGSADDLPDDETLGYDNA
ncbi:MAG TPA: segregation/condensation protein A [Planctomycetota bacterium]|nr:segregation/condensation protein A [Planctomycetota bacterium]